MVTDDERREVARRLRERAGKRVLNLSELLWCIGCDEGDDAAAWNRLAELIEPSDRNDELCVHCDYCDYCDLPKCSDQDGYSFKPKGYVDLLVLADKTIRTARHDMEICGDTVPAWYAAGRLEAVARNIREILGVES